MNIFISIDIECDGPIPGVNSMLAFGAVALSPRGVELDIFRSNLARLPGATYDEDTMRWWGEQPKAIWDQIRRNPSAPEHALIEYAVWLENFKRRGGTPVHVGYPIAFDLMWLHWYLVRFYGKDPCQHSGIDIKTLAAVALDLPYLKATKKRWPKHWSHPSLAHTHDPLDDAREQGYAFFRIMGDLAERNLLTNMLTG